MSSALYESSGSEMGDERSMDQSPVSLDIVTPKRSNNKRAASTSPKEDVMTNTSKATERHGKKRKEIQRLSPPWHIEGRLTPEEAPPVTITNATGSKITNKPSLGRRLSFGTIDGDSSDDTTATVNNTARPSIDPAHTIVEKREKRNPKPSQKVLYMRDEIDQAPRIEHVQNDITIRGKNDTRIKTPKSKVKAEEVPIQADEANPTSPVSSRVPPSTQERIRPNTNKRPVKTETAGDAYLLNLDSDQEVEMMWTATRERNTTPGASSISIKKYNRKQGKLREETLAKPNADETRTLEATNATQRKSNVPPEPVIKYSPCLLESYSALIKEAQQQGIKLDQISTLPLFETVLNDLKDDANSPYGMKNFRRFYAFTQNEIAYNPARAKYEDAGVQKDHNAIGGRLVPAGSGSNPLAPSLLFLSNGCVATCNLVKPTTAGSGSYIHSIKRIGIWLLMEEFDAMMAYMGKLYDRRQFYCQYFADILYFQTQKEGAAVRSVPIYDLRQTNFQVTPENLAQIHTFPRYMSGLSDLKHDHVVTVGYTINTFPYTQVQANKGGPPPLSISFNVQFILLHGITKPDTQGEARKYDEEEEEE